MRGPLLDRLHYQKWQQAVRSVCQGSNRRAWAICIVLIATIIGWTAAIAWNEHEAVIDDQAQQATNLSLLLAEEASRNVTVVDLVLQALQAKMKDRGVDSEAALLAQKSRFEVRADLIDSLQNMPRDNALLLLDAEGHLVSLSRPGDLPDIDARGRDYFEHFRGNNDSGLYISLPHTSRAGGSWRIFLSRQMLSSD